jgi:hypothetical protein
VTFSRRRYSARITLPERGKVKMRRNQVITGYDDAHAA